MPPLQENPILSTFSTHQEEDFDINRWTGKLIKPITITESNCVFETVASTETNGVQAEVWGRRIDLQVTHEAGFYENEYTTET